MSALPKLSDGLSKLRGIFRMAEDASNDEEMRLDGSSARSIFQMLSILHALAVDQEIELQCLRDMEAGRDLRRAAEALSSEQISALIGDHDDKIIRPDFGGSKK